MSKKNRERREEREGSGDQVGGGGGSAPWVPTVLAIVALVFAFYLWSDARKVQQDTAARLRSDESAITQLTTQLTAVRQQAKPQPQGPDPAKIYTVKLDGAPVRGNATAPIVIAEFSDYQ